MKQKISLIALLVVSLLFSTVAFARSSGGARATLINRTGYDIEYLYICPAGTEEWERCRGSFDDGDSIRVELPRHRNLNSFDIRCEYSNGREDMWYSIELYGSDRVTLLKNGRINNGSGSQDSNPFHSAGRHDRDDDHDDDYYRPQF